MSFNIKPREGDKDMTDQKIYPEYTTRYPLLVKKMHGKTAVFVSGRHWHGFSN